MRDIDRVIERVKTALPAVTWEQFKVCHPGSDDDGLWFFRLPGVDGEVQAESSTGVCPFLVETSKHGERATCRTVEQTADKIVELLRFEG